MSESRTVTAHGIFNNITNFSNSDPMEQLVKERGNLRAYKYPNLL